jgi:hypothetical protein
MDNTHNPNCPYCKGTGEIKAVAETVSQISYYECFGNGNMGAVAIRTESMVSMTVNTQLPADMVEEIKLKAEGYATITAHIPKGVPISHHDAHVWCRNDYEAGATEYATKLHECDKTNKALEETNRGLMEENESLTNQLKNQSHVHKDNMILLKQENEKARTILEKFISRHESDTMSWEFINEIKSFLNGTK